MKIDFSQKFKNLNGQVVTDSDSGKEVALSDVCVGALLSIDKQDAPSGVEKLRRYNLALEIYQGKKESLTAEEVVLLKELIGNYFTTIIVGQAFQMLEGA